MAIAYLKLAQHYFGVDQEKYEYYYDRYRLLVFSLKENFFNPASTNSYFRVAPYSSYLNGSIAGGVPTGTGYDTLHYEATLASVWFVFALTGFNPQTIDGGSGIPAMQPKIIAIQCASSNKDIIITISNPTNVLSYNVYYINALTDPYWISCATNLPVLG